MKIFVCAVCLIMAFSLILTADSWAAEKAVQGSKARTFWQRLFNYPAEVAEESVETVSETGKRGTEVVTDEIKRIGEVTSGDIAKTKELVTEPITGTAETAVMAVKETASIPVEAAKETAESTPMPAENK